MSSSFMELIQDVYDSCSKSLYPTAIWIFMKVCRAYNVVKDTTHEFIQSNEFAKSAVDEIAYQSQVIYSFMTNQRMESRDPVWLSTCWITTMNDIDFTYLEKTGYFFTRTFCNDLFDYNNDGYSQYAKNYLEVLCRSETKLTENKLDPLLIIKTLTPEGRPFYVVRKSIVPLSPFHYKRSTARFISVEYTHLYMSGVIVLTIGPEWFIVGNELFTPAFVMRMLEYQPYSYEFEKTYQIRIMDSDCNMVSFGCNQYVLVTEDGYELKNNDIDSDDGVIVDK